MLHLAAFGFGDGAFDEFKGGFGFGNLDGAHGGHDGAPLCKRLGILAWCSMLQKPRRSTFEARRGPGGWWRRLFTPMVACVVGERLGLALPRKAGRVEGWSGCHMPRIWSLRLGGAQGAGLGCGLGGGPIGDFLGGSVDGLAPRSLPVPSRALPGWRLRWRRSGYPGPPLPCPARCARRFKWRARWPWAFRTSRTPPRKAPPHPPRLESTMLAQVTSRDRTRDYTLRSVNWMAFMA